MTPPPSEPRPPDLARILARALRDLEAQATALRSASASLAEAQAQRAETRRIGFGTLRSEPQADDERPQPRLAPRASWARQLLAAPPLTRPTLFAYPGHMGAAIQEQPYLAVGYILGGETEAEIEEAVETVTVVSRSRRDFTPVFITGSTHFSPFLRHGYSFEYLPPRRHFGGDDASYALWRQRRLDFIAAKWGLASMTVLGDSPAAVAAGPLLLFFPDYRAANPYQALMYAGLETEIEVAAGTLEAALATAGGRPTIFHLHWQDAVTQQARVIDQPAAMAAFVHLIDAFRARGGLFAWTVHNDDPHDSPDLELSRAFASQLLARADLVHVHDALAAERLRPMLPSDAKIVVISHPAYAAADTAPDRAGTRLRLGVPDDETLFLTLGNIRRYKGIEPLLHVAAELADLPVRFLLAGRAGRYDPRAAAPGNCIVLSGHQTDDEVRDLLAAADFVLLPFEEVSTSGSLMLALSAGLPLISPALGAIAAIIEDQREGYLYSSDEPGALAAAIRRAAATPAWRREAMALAATATAGLHQPRQFATEIAAALMSLVAPPVRTRPRDHQAAETMRKARQ
ncbi:hypothetical protein VW23_002570 [Devosia insulae DS-56]|uniref:Glycosyl transferase family 1 domain-containing protein n=1 Tax=Devosia insulae DS-56 TaxID=1116389 RepID=A0A1E5XKJ3_9HYPH|nr:glycosyltransferase family 4 protein [Devosia insulae]OEO29095.1 hypothetical protein VW23_002570 [Devosia insulae DS-56]